MKILYFGRIHLKNTLGFTLVELLVVLALVGILAGLAVPKFIDINDTASKNALDAAVIDLNGREKVTWAEIKRSNDGWVDDTTVFSKVDTEFGSGFHWGPKAKKNGGKLHYGNNKVNLKRTPSTNVSAGKWKIKN